MAYDGATPVLKNVDENLEAALARLFELLKIDSISTDPAYADSCSRAADWLVDDLSAIGFDAQRHQTPGHPMVVGKQSGNRNGPHLLFYGHYDVQPVDPLELWRQRSAYDLYRSLPSVESSARRTTD